MKKKGVFLIFSLWLFLLLSLFCLGLGFRTFIGVRKTKLFLNKARAFSLAVSGVKLARVVLKEDDRNVDHLQEDWAKLREEENKVYFFSPKKEGKLSVMIEDESSRININKIEASILRKLFESKDIANSQEKIDYILDYIDIDHIQRQLGSEENVKNGSLNVMEELLLIRKISDDDYEKIKDLVSVFSDEKININTAPRELLEIFINGELKNEVFRVRFGRNLIEGDDDGYYGEGGQPLPDSLKNTFKSTSNLFRIISEAETEDVKKKITCVIDRNLDKILYWYEE